MSTQRQIESVRLAHATHLVYEAARNYQEAKLDHDRAFGGPSASYFVYNSRAFVDGTVMDEELRDFLLADGNP